MKHIHSENKSLVSFRKAAGVALACTAVSFALVASASADSRGLGAPSGTGSRQTEALTRVLGILASSTPDQSQAPGAVSNVLIAGDGNQGQDGQGNGQGNSGNASQGGDAASSTPPTVQYGADNGNDAAGKGLSVALTMVSSAHAIEVLTANLTRLHL